LNQEDINHLKRSISHNEIEAAMKSLWKKKSPEPHGFSAEFFQTFKEELIPTLLKLFTKQKEKEHWQTHFMKSLLHSSQSWTKKKNYRPISLLKIDANILNEILANQIDNI
jgi:hypothetical protein